MLNSPNCSLRVLPGTVKQKKCYIAFINLDGQDRDTTITCAFNASDNVRCTCAQYDVGCACLYSGTGVSEPSFQTYVHPCDVDTPTCGSCVTVHNNVAECAPRDVDFGAGHCGAGVYGYYNESEYYGYGTEAAINCYYAGAGGVDILCETNNTACFNGDSLCTCPSSTVGCFCRDSSERFGECILHPKPCVTPTPAPTPVPTCGQSCNPMSFAVTFVDNTVQHFTPTSVLCTQSDFLPPTLQGVVVLAAPYADGLCLLPTSPLPVWCEVFRPFVLDGPCFCQPVCTCTYESAETNGTLFTTCLNNPDYTLPTFTIPTFTFQTNTPPPSSSSTSTSTSSTSSTGIVSSFLYSFHFGD